MKIAAHPLVVAVALGFLDPQVLSSEDAAEEGATETGAGTPEVPDVDVEDFARIEAEWQQVRGLV